MRTPHFALVILVLLFVALSLQAQIMERRTATVSGRVVLKGEPARNSAKLRCLKIEVDLKPCRRVSDQVVNHR
jgi:hypothetical protein